MAVEEDFNIKRATDCLQQPARVRKWQVTPPELMPWISSQERDRAIVLLDFEPDVLPSGELRFDLRVAIKCVPVRQERLSAHEDFYIGCASASVQLDVEGAQIHSYTPGREIAVAYKVAHKRTRASKASIEPALELGSPSHEGKLAAGGIALESGGESVFESSFSSSECSLAAVNLGSSVIWRLDPPSRQPVVREFLFCNLHLHAICSRGTGAIRGQITVRPSDLLFFGPDRRLYKDWKKVLMRFDLLRARRSLYRSRGIAVKFSEATS